MLRRHRQSNRLSISSTKCLTSLRRQWSQPLVTYLCFQEPSQHIDSKLSKELLLINTSFSRAMRIDWWLNPFRPTCILLRIVLWDLKCLLRRTVITRFISVGNYEFSHVVNTAVATTDIPSNLNILIRQRRRWLNGSFFAGLYAMKEWSRLYTESGHSLWRKFILTLQLVYMSVNLCRLPPRC